MNLCTLLVCAFAYIGDAHASGLLFSHMAANGDIRLEPENDDSFVNVPLVCDYHFYSRPLNDVYVGTNGYVTRYYGHNGYYPKSMASTTRFPLGMIAPLFSDNMLDPTPPNNNVWYRETQDPEMLTKARDIIQSQFQTCGGPGFEPTCVFIVTWQRPKSYCEVMGWSDCFFNESYYNREFSADATSEIVEGIRQEAKAIGEKLMPAAADRGHAGINGYQLVLATDGVMTFSIFNMHTIQWDCCWDYHTSGFSAGDYSRSCDLPGSGTAAIVNLTTDSNVGKPGRWVYRVDESVVDPQCNSC